jgi:hypothetical protein
MKYDSYFCVIVNKRLPSLPFPFPFLYHYLVETPKEGLNFKMQQERANSKPGTGAPSLETSGDI